MQNAKRGISKVSVCWALKIFNWCQFHPFSKSLAIPTVQQFEGATSHPKGFGKVKTSIVFFWNFVQPFFSLCIFFPDKIQLTALNAGSTEKSMRRGFVRRRILTSSKVLWGVKHEFSVCTVSVFCVPHKSFLKRSDFSSYLHPSPLDLDQRSVWSVRVSRKIGGSAWVSGNSRRIQRHQKEFARPQVASCNILLLLCSIANIPEP